MEWYWYLVIWIVGIHTLRIIWTLATDDTVVKSRTHAPNRFEMQLHLNKARDRVKTLKKTLKEMKKNE
jgi:hypothetical protein